MSEKMQLSKERMGEIALLLLTHQTAKNLPTVSEMKREVPSKARELGLSVRDAQAFMDQILPEAVKIRLGCKSVQLDWSV